ncbi:zf-TFIIB domain-containing protein [Pseudarthrobacter sp. R1]|uniref:TFIIB-type zinc ribbon-containing protein n=1 Tax=Pseudarthrobacter sp. R1 TaxID=2944934 RepID=UPI00210A343C|nr:zf-TFIIB domain-containing protein [Pseudarthrobacter sp. R1]MCQ6271885.1 zf-TFIIB domain-containing protein [Pseudarthrobacter sp. R1]
MNTSPSTLTCPKCGAEMRPYERNGIIIDQCDGCRGIFLDRGELESLMDAESSFYAARNPAPASPQPPYGPPAYPDRRDGHHDSGHGDRHDRRKRGGFLGDLFG